MKLTIFLMMSLVLSFALRDRARFVLAVAVALIVCVPSYATALLTDLTFPGGGSGIPSLLPATWLVLAAVLVQFITRPGKILSVVRTHKTVLLLGAVAFWMLAITVSQQGSTGLAQWLDNVVGLSLLILLAILDDRTGPFLRRVVVALGVGEAVLALLQALTGQDFLFVAEKAAAAGLQGLGPLLPYRTSGTLDHPLNLSLFLLIALGCCSAVKNAVFRTLLQVLFIAAVASSGSRAGLVLSISLVVVQALLARPGTTALRRYLPGVVTIGLAAVVLASTTVGNVLSQRLADDLGSAAFRVDAFRIIPGIVSSRWLAGSGVGSNFVIVSGVTGTAYSLENPVLMYAVDVGIVATALFFGCLFALTLRRAIPWAWKAVGLWALFDVLTYSSIATRSDAPMLLAVALALVVAHQSTRDHAPPSGNDFSQGQFEAEVPPRIARESTSPHKKLARAPVRSPVRR
jgi:hypothetical protein